MEQHPNSRKITIVRTESFMDAAQTQAKEFMSMSKKSIGSYWKSVNARMVGTGLDYNEQEALLPHIINCEPGDRDFKSKVSEFYNGLITRIPFGVGLELEVGLLVDNSKPVGVRLDAKGNTVDKGGVLNLPIEIMDYIRYRHAMGHPQVAMDKESAFGDSLKLYFIYDPEVADTRMAQTNDAKDKALLAYMELKDKPEKINSMLVLLGVDPREFSGANAPALRAERLRLIADKEYDRFNQIYKVDNFELRVKVEGFVLTGIFNKVGDRIYETSTKKLIGLTMDETIKLLQDPAYSENLMMWSASYQDIMAKPKLSSRRKAPVNP